MTTRSRRRVLMALGGCLFGSLSGQACAADDVLTVGVVPQYSPREILQSWGPVLDEISRRSGVTWKLLGNKDIPSFELALEAGEFDFAYANPYQGLRANRKQGYVPMVRDQTPLAGILVVRKDSRWQKVADLAGQAIAFPAPNSLGASLLMRAELDAVHQLTFSAQYSASHSSAYLSTLRGLTAATGGVESTFQLLSAADKASLRVLYRTRETPSHPFMAHPRVPDVVRRRIEQAWLELAADPAWDEALARIPFDHLVKTRLEDYKVLDRMDLGRYYVAPSP